MQYRAAQVQGQLLAKSGITSRRQLSYNSHIDDFKARTAHERNQAIVSGKIPNRPPEFDELQLMLIDADAVAYASECHGIVCGLVSGGGRPSPRLWVDYALDGRSEDDTLTRQCLAALQDLTDATVAGFNSEDFTLELLLPDDDAPLAQRISAFADWCAGFLLGFGSIAPSESAAMSDITLEFISDLTEFSRIDTTVEGAERDNEADFLELVEYVKAGSLLVHEEARLEHLTANSSESIH